jgi:hypothetical protein
MSSGKPPIERPPAAIRREAPPSYIQAVQQSNGFRSMDMPVRTLSIQELVAKSGLSVETVQESISKGTRSRPNGHLRPVMEAQRFVELESELAAGLQIHNEFNGPRLPVAKESMDVSGRGSDTVAALRLHSELNGPILPPTISKVARPGGGMGGESDTVVALKLHTALNGPTLPPTISKVARANAGLHGESDTVVALRVHTALNGPTLPPTISRVARANVGLPGESDTVVALRVHTALNGPTLPPTISRVARANAGLPGESDTVVALKLHTALNGPTLPPTISKVARANVGKPGESDTVVARRLHTALNGPDPAAAAAAEPDLGEAQCPACLDTFPAAELFSAACDEGHRFCREDMQRHVEARLRRRERAACPMCENPSRGVSEAEVRLRRWRWRRRRRRRKNRWGVGGRAEAGMFESGGEVWWGGWGEAVLVAAHTPRMLVRGAARGTIGRVQRGGERQRQ